MTIVLEWKQVALVMGLVAGLASAGWERPAGAASRTANKVVPLHEVQSPSLNRANRSLSRTPTQTIDKGTSRRSLQNGRTKGPSTDRALGNRSRGKVSGQRVPAGGVEKASQSLAYHKIIQQPHRYDPGRDLRKSRGAVLNPAARELQVDHFQELDRNQDGVLDPLERTIGRLDIERDLNNR